MVLPAAALPCLPLGQPHPESSAPDAASGSAAGPLWILSFHTLKPVRQARAQASLAGASPVVPAAALPCLPLGQPCTLCPCTLHSRPRSFTSKAGSCADAPGEGQCGVPCSSSPLPAIGPILSPLPQNPEPWNTLDLQVRGSIVSRRPGQGSSCCSLQQPSPACPRMLDTKPSHSHVSSVHHSGLTVMDVRRHLGRGPKWCSLQQPSPACRWGSRTPRSWTHAPRAPQTARALGTLTPSRCRPACPTGGRSAGVRALPCLGATGSLQLPSQPLAWPGLAWLTEGSFPAPLLSQSGTDQTCRLQL